MEGLGAAANVIAVVHISAKVLECCSRYIINVRNARDDRARLYNKVAELDHILNDAKDLLATHGDPSLQASRAFLGAIKSSEVKLERLMKLLKDQPRKSSPGKTIQWKWPFQKEDVEVTIHGLEACRDNLSAALQIGQTKILAKIDTRTLFDKLLIASGAAFDSYAEDHQPTCLLNTRVELLDQIEQWILDTDARTIFWLKGMAGTGKSTISRTVARELPHGCILGASFFFKKGESERRDLYRFCATIAQQLAGNVPSTAPHIKQAIEAEPTIQHKGYKEQCIKLIREPLSKAAEEMHRGTKSTPSTVVIVIDALDECDNDAYMKLLIHLFSETRTIQNLRLRIFMTSRPEIPIRLGFKADHVRDNHQNLVLHEIPEPIVERDISAFLSDRLDRIRDDYEAQHEEGCLPLPWPDPRDVETLTRKTAPLFIFAATICLFISENRLDSPDISLWKIIDYQHTRGATKLGMTYSPVLNQQLESPLSLSRNEKEDIIVDFRAIVGAVVLLAHPLSVVTLSKLLGFSQARISHRLGQLHSVLNVPDSTKEPVRLLHLSFRDYLVDPEHREENDFSIDEGTTHGQLL